MCPKHSLIWLHGRINNNTFSCRQSVGVWSLKYNKKSKARGLHSKLSWRYVQLLLAYGLLFLIYLLICIFYLTLILYLDPLYLIQSSEELVSTCKSPQILFCSFRSEIINFHFGVKCQRFWREMSSAELLCEISCEKGKTYSSPNGFKLAESSHFLQITSQGE